MTRPLLVSACLAALTLTSPALAQTSRTHDLRSSNEAATRGPADASLVGALHEFAYERGALYAVQASPQRITDIALEPGETLLSVSAGDTTRDGSLATHSPALRATSSPTSSSNRTPPTSQPTSSS
jgi:type IV secretory pathway VirB9-like protein